MLLNTYNHHYTLYISYLVYLSPCVGLGPLCDLFFIFSLIFIVINNLIKTDAFVFVYFLEYLLLWKLAWMLKANNVQIAKVQPQGIA